MDQRCRTGGTTGSQTNSLRYRLRHGSPVVSPSSRSIKKGGETGRQPRGSAKTGLLGRPVPPLRLGHIHLLPYDSPPGSASTRPDRKLTVCATGCGFARPVRNLTVCATGCGATCPACRRLGLETGFFPKNPVSKLATPPLRPPPTCAIVLGCLLSAHMLKRVSLPSVPSE